MSFARKKYMTGEIMKKILLFILCTSTAGCSAIQAVRGPAWPWQIDVDKQETTACKGACTDQDALVAFSKATQYCRTVWNFYECAGNYSNAAQLEIGWLGAISGAVIAPVASPTAAKGWAGLSGASNGMQKQLTDMFSSSVAVKKQSAVANFYRDKHVEVMTEQVPVLAVKKAMALAAGCSGQPAKVETSVLQAIDAADTKKD